MGGTIMWRFSGWCALVLSALVALGGCGSDRGEDDLVLSFQGFTAVADQPDSVGQNTADVDVCQDICASGEGSLEGEPFSVTRVGASFVNQGKADITLDSYTMSVFRDLNGNGERDPGEPGSGVPDMTFSASTLIPGGRCVSDPQTKCALDNECPGGSCVRQEATVELLLYDFTFKDLVKDGECPFDLDSGVFTGGSIVPQTYDAVITFRGTDDANGHYRITRSYNSTFANFDNCDNQ